MSQRHVALVGLIVGLVVPAVHAQQAPAAQADVGAFAPPPVTWPSPPLPDGPILIESAVERNLRIVVTKGLEQPWSLAFLPDGRILVTERRGRLRVISDGKLDPTPVAGLPAISASGLQGLMDIVLHPRFAENRWVY